MTTFTCVNCNIDIHVNSDVFKTDITDDVDALRCENCGGTAIADDLRLYLKV